MELVGQAQGGVNLLHTLVRIAEHPKRLGGKVVTAHARVVPTEPECLCMMFPRVVERCAFLRKLPARRELTMSELCRPLRMVGLEDEARVVLSLRQARHFVGQLVCCSELAIRAVKPPQAP